MKRKNLYLDSKKFNLFLERMENKMTLSESTEKILLTEGWLDDLLKATKNVGSEALTVMAKNLPSEISVSIKNAWDELIVAAKNIDEGITKSLTDLSLIRNSIGIDAISNLKNQYRNLTRTIINSLSFEENVLKQINDYVFGELTDLPASLVKTLSNSEIQLLESLRLSFNKNMNELDILDDLVKTAQLLGDNPNILDLFNTKYTSGTVKTIEEFVNDFDFLNNFTKNDPESKISQLWEQIKSRVDGKPKNGVDAGELLKNTIKNSDTYITVQRNWRKRFIEFLARKIMNKVNDINIELNSKQINWDLSVVFVGKSGDLNIVTARNKAEFDRLYAYLQKNGLNPRKLDSSGVKGSDISIPQTEAVSKRKNRRWKWIKIGIITGLGIGGVWLGFCVANSQVFTDEQLEYIDIADEGRVEGEEKIEEPGYLDKILQCLGRKAYDAAKLVKELGVRLFKTNVEPRLMILEGMILSHLNEKCGRGKDSRRDENGEWDKPCTECLDCTKDFDLTTIVNDQGVNLSDKYLEIVNSLDPSLLFPGADEQSSKFKSLMQTIKNDARFERVSGYLTEDGEAIDLKTIVNILCSRHRLNCIVDELNKKKIEFYAYGNDNPDASCENIKKEQDDIITDIIQYNVSGLLNWGKMDGKIDLSVWATDDEFTGAASIDNVIQLMKEHRDGLFSICNDNAAGKKKEKEGELLQNLSNIMDEMWEEGTLKLDCGIYKFSLLSKNKIDMHEALIDIIYNLETDKQMKGFFKGLDVNSPQWETSFNSWWDKQRALCGITE